MENFISNYLSQQNTNLPLNFTRSVSTNLSKVGIYNILNGFLHEYTENKGIFRVLKVPL